VTDADRYTALTAHSDTSWRRIYFCRSIALNRNRLTCQETSMPAYGDYQNTIYLAGLRGVQPRLPVDFKSLELKARGALSRDIASYVMGGCGNEQTQDTNVTAFEHWGLIPRMMVDCSKRDMSIDLFGLSFPSPIFMCPIGVVSLCAQDGHGDLAAARSSLETQVPFVASTLSGDPLEKIASELQGEKAFFQLYTPSDKDVAESLISRAEAVGYKALIVTLDTWLTGWRPRDLNEASFPQLRGHALANYFSDPQFLAKLRRSREEDLPAAIAQWARIFGRSLSWADLPWLRSATKLPLILKGICHPDDVRRAIDGGVDGIYCSNHGGRQANGGIPAIDMLPAVVEAAGSVPVLFDSGVRSGTDVVKALALGARAVGIGRPYIYGLALDGVNGINHVLRSILAEADLLMAVDGYPTISDLTPSAIMRL
jgi:lactate 2-monooxygenase